MSEDTVIAVENVSKAYRIWRTPASRLTSPILFGMGRSLFGGTAPGRALQRKAATGFSDFWALTELNIEIKRGEAFGIIGRNGSGKSTLLQIIAGTLTPTDGNIQVRGRIAALLELGSGFNPDFTGRENVFLNAAVLGLSRRQTEERFDAIAAFADIGEFLEYPVKTYSSGMQMRLAFAVAAHVDPDILIIDEALSVGDARFQLKCARAIDRFVGDGVTLLFVSHDLNMVKRLCSRAVLLEAGRSVYAGFPNDVANLYSKLIADGGTIEALKDDIKLLNDKGLARTAQHRATDTVPEPSVADPPQVATDDSEEARLRARIKALEATIAESGTDRSWSAKVETMLRMNAATLGAHEGEFSYGGELGRILDFSMQEVGGTPQAWFTTGTNVEVRMQIEAASEIQEPIFAMTIKDRKGQDIYGTNTLFSRQSTTSLVPGAQRTVRFVFHCNLMPGEYFLSLGFTQFVGDELVVIHRRYDAALFSVHGVDRCFGIANCFAQISVDPT